MPRIQDDVLECPVYLYPDQSSAKAGERAGGTGFIIGMRSPNFYAILHLYIVTNSHVVMKHNSPVIRINKTTGGLDYQVTQKGDWILHPSGDDVAIMPIGLSSDHKYAWINTEMFLSRDDAINYSVGPGDDVFMVGRLISHDGKQSNTPTARFGNVSMSPKEPVYNPELGNFQESYLIDVRSIGGYSGSPVFLHFLPIITPPRPDIDKYVGPYLLGVEWCYFTGNQDVLKSKKPHPDGWYVEYNTGISGVVPAWKISGLLQEDKVKRQRKDREEQMAREAGESGVNLTDSESQDRPFTRSDFEDALRKVSRPDKALDTQPDQRDDDAPEN